MLCVLVYQYEDLLTTTPIIYCVALDIMGVGVPHPHEDQVCRLLCCALGVTRPSLDLAALDLDGMDDGGGLDLVARQLEVAGA